MRVRVHHRLKVVEGSVLFAAVLQANRYLSLILFYPIMLALIGLKWKRLGFVDRAWYLSIVTAFTVLEIPRLYLGVKGNKHRSVSSMIGFVALTFFTNIAIMIVYNIIVPRKTSLDYSMSILELIFAFSEILLALIETRRMVRSNTVKFYVGEYDDI